MTQQDCVFLFYLKVLSQFNVENVEQKQKK